MPESNADTLRRVYRTILGLLAATGLVLVGCGSSSTEPETANVYGRAPATSGGEVESTTTDPEATNPPPLVVLRGTIPVPVPQPAIAREQLSANLQAVWTRVEEQVSVALPEGPEETSVANVQAWADGPFREWLTVRRDALTETRELLAEVPNEPAHERSLALALWAYAFEDLGAQVGGAPVPAEIAEDEELRGIYIASLNAASVPLAQRAMELYADCQRRLLPLGDQSEWLPWRAYCVQRGIELIEGYGLSAEPEEISEE